jgi:6-pyruvoyl-tetrahydropterin synthase
MFSVTVRDSIMIAHSLKGEVFGPAQRLHGATFVVEVTLRRAALDENGIVADIGRATTLLSDILSTYAYRNLDDLIEFQGRNSTTEALAKEIYDRYADGIRTGRLEGDAKETITSLSVVLRENPDAWAGYDAPLKG